MMRGCLPYTAGPLCLLIVLCADAQEWTRFRGPNGSGVSDATTVPVKWTEKDYNWKVKLPGVGHSSPVLWGERIFIAAGEEETGKRLVCCLRAQDGSKVWQREFAGEKHGKHTDNSFASATPAVDERHVYVCWGTPKEFIVLALDHDGKEIWRTDLGPFRSGHGFGASPIVHDDLVVVPNDQDGKGTLLALDRKTGDLRWKVPRKSQTATFSTPCVFQPKGGLAQLIFTSWDHGITSIDPKTGRVNWEGDIFSKGHIETSIASPIVAGDLVLGTSGWLGVKMEVVAIRPGADQKKSPSEAYRLVRSAPLVCTPVVKDDLLFIWSDNGVVTCANVESGEVYWRERVPGSYYGSPVVVGKCVYCISREGDVIVLAASKKFELLARNRLGEGSHSTPAVAGGAMYLRTYSQLISVGGKN